MPGDQIAHDGSASKEFRFALVISTLIRSPTFLVEFFMKTGWFPRVRPATVFAFR